MPLSERLALKAIASEALTWPLPRVLARAESLELSPEGKAPRVLRVMIGGEPPLPEELDELYAAARAGIDVDVRWVGLGGSGAGGGAPDSSPTSGSPIGGSPTSGSPTSGSPGSRPLGDATDADGGSADSRPSGSGREGAPASATTTIRSATGGGPPGRS